MRVVFTSRGLEVTLGSADRLCVHTRRRSFVVEDEDIPDEAEPVDVGELSLEVERGEAIATVWSSHTQVDVSDIALRWIFANALKFRNPELFQAARELAFEVAAATWAYRPLRDRRDLPWHGLAVFGLVVSVPYDRAPLAVQERYLAADGLAADGCPVVRVYRDEVDTPEHWEQLLAERIV